jgi:hypothetical protein
MDNRDHRSCVGVSRYSMPRCVVQGLVGVERHEFPRWVGEMYSI